MAGKLKQKSNNFTMFQKSTPWGYHPEEVESKIHHFQDLVNRLTQKVQEEQQANMQLINRCKHLENELREMHIQMSSLELPDVNEAVGNSVLNEFKDSMSSSGNSKHEYDSEETDNFDSGFLTCTYSEE